MFYPGIFILTKWFMIAVRKLHVQKQRVPVSMAAGDLRLVNVEEVDLLDFAITPMAKSPSSLCALSDPLPDCFTFALPGSDVDERAVLIAEGDQNPQQQLRSKSNSDSSTWDGCACLPWYMRNPMQDAPTIYFFAYFLAAPLLSMIWFIQQDIAFLITGPLTMTMCIYAIHRFKTSISISLNSEVDSFQKDHREKRLEWKLLEKEIERMQSEQENLEDTKTALVESFARYEENLGRLQAIEEKTKMLGLKLKAFPSRMEGAVVEED